jgi:hypothetical protein
MYITRKVKNMETSYTFLCVQLPLRLKRQGFLMPMEMAMIRRGQETL